MTEGLVSIITPCYNGENFVAGFFENIIAQTYKKIELFFINDGSTDNTEQIAQSYRARLEEAGIIYHYIYQENAGQAAAINKGLARFSGEYLMWTDSDDLLHPDNIRKKVDFLQSHPEYGFVMCRGIAVLENDVNHKLWDMKRLPPHGEDTFFRDMILEKNVVFTPGVYMARGEEFVRVLPSRHIYESRVGQNWQMLLPLAYNCKCGYMTDELFYYVVRQESHSRQERTLEEELDKLQRHDETLRVILKDMGLGDSQYMELLDDKLVRKEFDKAYEYKDKEILKVKYNQLKKMGKAGKRDTLIYMAGTNKIVDCGYTLFKLAKSKIRDKK